MKKNEIKFDERNYRKHSDQNKALIKKSLEELGAGRSVLLDNENSLIAGNGVYEQAKALGIPVRVVETDGSELIAVKRTDVATKDEKRKKLALADNAASDISEWDIPVLEADWAKDVLADWGVDIIGKEKEKQDGDVPFTEVLGEEHNYLVLYFDDSVDWLQAQTIFGLKPVMNYSTRKDGVINKGNKKIGVGRIIKGTDFINKLLAEK